MIHVRNYFQFYLLLKIFELLIICSESTTSITIIPGDEILLTCSESKSITIINISAQNIGKCDSNTCYLNDDDLSFIKECERSQSCIVNGSRLTSACLWVDLHFSMSYMCRPEVYYEYIGCYLDDDDRVLEDEHKFNWKMSADICFSVCAKKWREGTYFGTQYARECFCGNGSKLDSPPYVNKNDSECNMTCLQNPDEKCGGRWRMSVYRIMRQDHTYECLNIDEEHTIPDCETNQLKENSLCIALDTSYKNQDVNYTCIDFGNKLFEFCKNEHHNSHCDFNLSKILKDAVGWQPSKNISIEYTCEGEHSTSSSTQRTSSFLPTSTVDYTSVSQRSKQTSKNTTDTGTVVGIVVGSVLFLCIVFIGIWIGRRFVFCNKYNEKLKNNPEANDYVWNQNIALPQAVSPTTRNTQYDDLQNTSGSSTNNYSSTNIQLQNIDDEYDYAKTIETNKSKTFNDKTSTPTYLVLQNDTYNPNLDANNDEYAVVDPTAVSSFQQTPKTSTQGSENYMILDPSQTGIDRSKFTNTGQAYELAKPVNNTRGHTDDMYALSPEGTYDHSGITRHRKDLDTIYTHAVDNVYDSASRGENIARKEDTYDHFFGKETEDEYNISMH